MNFEWTPLNVDTPALKERFVNGVHCHVALSPYDVPLAIRGYSDDAEKTFTFEFRYVTADEPVEMKSLNPFTQGTFGQKTGRIYKMVVNIEQLVKQLPPPAQAERPFASIFKSITETDGPSRNTDYYRLTERILNDQAKRQFHAS